MAPNPPAPEVLFVCVHNAGRSQMAAALLCRAGDGRIHVTSGAPTPANEVNPVVVEAMAEIGIDISRESPKAMTGAAVKAADVVVTMGCGDACPIFPGKTYLDWSVPDPAGRGLDEVRAIRDEIAARVDALAHELLS